MAPMAKPFLQKQIFNNFQTKLKDIDVLSIHLTRDGTFMFETLDDACELSLEDMIRMHEEIGKELQRLSSKSKPQNTK